VAVDFSAASRPLVRYAGDFETGAALELFHAIDTHDEARLRSAEASTAAVQAYRREVLQYAQERLYRLSNVFDARRNRVGTLIGRGDLARQLTVQQESADADLVVLGQEHRSWLMELLRGSVARRLLAGCLQSDLLVVPHAYLGVMPGAAQPACPEGRLTT
jgi:nucleotide-binding universal stress UspA family protein